MEKEHIIEREGLPGYGDVRLTCTCGWKSRTVNVLADNYATRTLQRLHNEHLRNPDKK
jgi:hypothetical protein